MKSTVPYKHTQKQTATQVSRLFSCFYFIASKAIHILKIIYIYMTEEQIENSRIIASCFFFKSTQSQCFNLYGQTIGCFFRRRRRRRRHRFYRFVCRSFHLNSNYDNQKKQRFFFSINEFQVVTPLSIQCLIAEDIWLISHLYDY